jgi:hypothetical protein
VYNISGVTYHCKWLRCIIFMALHTIVSGYGVLFMVLRTIVGGYGVLFMALHTIVSGYGV